VVDRLPKTRSGKILRGTMVKIADGESFKTPATIDDPAILDEIWRFYADGAAAGAAASAASRSARLARRQISRVMPLNSRLCAGAKAYQ
jgi:hypothetical protein